MCGPRINDVTFRFIRNHFSKCSSSFSSSSFTRVNVIIPANGSIRFHHMMR